MLSTKNKNKKKKKKITVIINNNKIAEVSILYISKQIHKTE